MKYFVCPELFQAKDDPFSRKKCKLLFKRNKVLPKGNLLLNFKMRAAVTKERDGVGVVE